MIDVALDQDRRAFEGRPVSDGAGSGRRGGKRERGQGSIFRKTYIDRRTGKTRKTETWYVKYYHQGRPIEEPSHSRQYGDAKKLLARRLGEIAIGGYTGPEVDKTSYEDLKAMALDHYRANGRKSIDRLEDAIGHLDEFFSGVSARRITRDRITAYIADRRQKAANATINRELAALKLMFSLGERAGRVAKRPYIVALEEHNIRQGFFEGDEFKEVLAHLPGDLRPVFEVAYITGWRVRSEILTRQKSHLDLRAGWLRLEPGETKNGKGRMFPLVACLREVLERQLERTRETEHATGRIIPWLFHRNGTRIKSFRRAWLTACKRGDVGNRIPHDFRRTAIRNLERAGVPRSAAMAMVGHLTESVYRRYAIVDEGMLNEAGSKLQTFYDDDNERSLARSDSGSAGRLK